MPWSVDLPPASMRGLPPTVRRKAVEIANALLREGMDEGRAIRIATATARAWALHAGRDRDRGTGRRRARDPEPRPIPAPRGSTRRR